MTVLPEIIGSRLFESHGGITAVQRSSLLCLSLTSSLSFLFVVILLAGTAIGQPQTTGQWSTLPYAMPINPVHAALLRDGRVVIVSGTGNDPSVTNLQAAVWDPQSGSIATQTISWDMFCNGMVTLPDGRVFVNGGTLQYGPFKGQSKSSVFDPATDAFTDLQNMAHGRWYPTVTVLGDGRVMTFSGLDENGTTNSSVEIYTAGSGWSQPFTSPWNPPLYPRLHLLPSGKVFYSGSTTSSRLFDPSTGNWSGTIATTNYTGTRTYGSSVLLPLLPANNYDPRVLILGGGNPATATTEIIDLGAVSPAWKSGPNMSQARIEMNAVMLPNGKVLALGGSVNDEDLTTVSYNADLYDPVANTITSAGANAFPRLYHSVALLLPDATVWLAGGNPVRGTYESHMEIYQPAYLFQADGTAATRPTISSAPATINYGNSFTVQTPDADNIASVVLVRNGASTHAFDMDQRLVGMTFTGGSGALTVTAPPNGNIAPPGYYMLFLLDDSGVPSVASFVQLASPLVPPDFAIAPSPSSQTISPGNSTSYNVIVTGSGGFNGSVGLNASGLPQGATATFSPTAVVGSGASTLTISTASTIALGTYSFSIGGTSGTLSHSTNANLVVAPPPTITSLSPTSGPSTGSTAVTITGTNFVSGATVSFGTSSATGVSVVSSTSIKATSPAHTVGSVTVVVTNPGGLQSTSPATYAYTAPPPTITSLSPRSGSTAGGTSVKISGTGFQSGAKVTFGGVAATNVVFGSATSITATTPPHAVGPVDVQVTNPNGQKATLAASNLLLNPGFESAGASWKFSGTGSAAVLNVAGRAHSGSYYAELTSASGQHPVFGPLTSTGATAYFAVTPGQTVNFSAWTFRVSGDGSARIALAAYDANKANPTYISASPSNVTSAAWLLQKNTYAVPTGKAFVRAYLEIYQNTTSAVARFDDTSLITGGFTYK